MVVVGKQNIVVLRNVKQGKQYYIILQRDSGCKKAIKKGKSKHNLK